MRSDTGTATSRKRPTPRCAICSSKPRTVSKRSNAEEGTAMALPATVSLIDTLRSAVQPLTGGAHDYDALIDIVGDARFVLIGEASHGTHEFYAERAAITKRLIAERGFTAVA